MHEAHPLRLAPVTDLVAQRADHTTVTIYTHWKPYIEEVSAWARGKAPDCKND